jgi:hypothetical protein
MKSMGVEELTVKYLGMDRGKIKLSRKAILDEKYGNNKDTSSIDTQNGTPNGEEKDPSMSKEEIDAIAQAVEGIQDL